MTLEPSDSWLHAANERYRAADTPPKQRPWLAWSDFAREREVTIDSTHPIVKRIFSWFRANTQEGSMSMGPLFRAAYYFDTSFWPLDIPVVFGTVALDLFSRLTTMS